MGEDATLPRSGILPPWTNVRVRCVEPELMDRQDLDSTLRQQALAGLRRINFFSLTVQHLWRPIQDFARTANRPVRVLDIASGGGDVVLGLSRRARRARLPIEVHGCDLNPEAVNQANARATSLNTEAKFFVCDVMANPVPKSYDIITNTLFMHHFEDHDARRVLEAIRAAQPKRVIVSDLARSTLGFLLAQLACYTLTRSYVVHYDGPRSVAAAFTAPEFSALANEAGLTNHTIRSTWPFRFLFRWDAP
ncbi:MAG: methyltransferase domain-containing protein [Candidatus Hydrogenedentes bacterium]|nr:methyltransferase domain-containing protein [Candidatus Hydrogenedentota bacterium]